MKLYKDIKHYHEFLPKEDRPKQGKTYLVTKDDNLAYMAEFTDYNGGCWATVKVLEPAEQYKSLYTPGMSFDIKVAHYTFQEVTSEESQPNTEIN